MYSSKAVEVLLKESAQLDYMNTFDPQGPTPLSRDEKKLALRIINMIKEKRDGRIKGRTCVDGRPQRQYIS